MRQAPTTVMCTLLLLSLISAGVARSFAVPGSDSLEILTIEPKAGVTTPGSKVIIYGSGLSPDAIVYFGGLQVRVTNFLDRSTLVIVTPYLRPGTYQIQLKSGGSTIRSALTFTSLPAAVDDDIDRALVMAGKGETSAAINILTAVATTHPDYQVRALAYYEISQIYFAKGDWWRWAGQAGNIFVDSDKSGPAVQTSWRYRLANDLSDYLLPTNDEPDHDVKMADFLVAYDVTDDPEPRFYRGLINARYGNLAKAKEDVSFILAAQPRNPSFRALATYVAVLDGEKPDLRSIAGEAGRDARALSLLGEAAFLSGNIAQAENMFRQSAQIYPLGADLAYLAGKKHFARGQRRIAVSLLTACAVMAPDSDEASAAKALLAALQGPGQP